MTTNNPLELKHAIKVIRELLAAERITQSELAARTNYSSTTWSLFFEGKYNGSVEKVEKTLIEFVLEWEKREEVVDTKVRSIVRKGAAFALERKIIGMMTGRSGVGKTTALEELEQERNDVIVITCHRATRPIGIFDQMLRKVGSNPDAFTNIDSKVSEIIWALHKKDMLIIIDEADRVNPRTLDITRSIWDAKRCGMLIIGLPILEVNIRKGTSRRENLDYLHSRIAFKWTLPPPSDHDLEKYLKANNAKLSHKLLKEIRGWMTHAGELRVLSQRIEVARDIASKNGGIITDDILMAAHRQLEGISI